MDLKAFLDEIASATEATLDRLLPAPEGLEAELYMAMRYSVFAGGKRLRPALFMATLLALGENLEAELEAYLPFAAALEMIHTYSLIHDDLPAMDNDDMRRGRPTCHKTFCEATAILAGDALLTHAFATMMKLKKQVSASRLCDAVDEVALSAGVRGMVSGQMVDLLLEGYEAEVTELQYMVQRKTGALFSASILAAAHLAGATTTQLQVLRSYSEQLGLTFQIADDVLDITGDPEKLGKPIGSDAKNNKTTFVSLLGLGEATALAYESAEQAVLTLAPFSEQADLLRQFPQMMLKRDR